MRAFIWYKDIENPSSSLWDTKVFLKIFEVIWIMIHDPDQNLKNRLSLSNGRCIMWENFRKICPAVSEELSAEKNMCKNGNKNNNKNNTHEKTNGTNTIRFPYNGNLNYFRNRSTDLQSDFTVVFGRQMCIDQCQWNNCDVNIKVLSM